MQFLACNSFPNEISEIKNLESRIVVNNQNKSERF